MRADKIKTIIGNINDLPYKTILFDGTWGVGKSYAVNEALAGNPDVCKISMFGMTDARQIYHEVLFQLALKNNVGGKIGEIANNIIEGAAKVWDKVGQARDVVQNIANERELFLLLSKEFTFLHIVVIDDLERMNSNMNLEEIFGIIEELKQCNYVKVILVANTAEMSKDKKEIFDKYSEKVIERTYAITERAESVEWSKLHIHAQFIEKFLNLHKVENLRTLEKAQRFYDDVILFCEDCNKDEFLEELRLICYAIVVESTHNLYYKEDDPNNTDSVKKMVSSIENTLEHRIGKYLYGTKSSNNLTGMLLRYYQEGTLDKAQLEAEYRLFLKSGDKPNYYKTDAEIKVMLPDLKKGLLQAKNIVELNEFADSYMVWSDILEEDNEDVLTIYKNGLNKMLKQAVRDGKEEILTHSYDLFHMSSDKVKIIYMEENENMKEFLIETYVEHLRITTHGEKAYQFSYKLRNYFSNSYYHEIIMTKVDQLYNKTSFPVGDVDQNRYHICYNIMYLLYHADKEKFLNYCTDIKKDCDKMSRHRIEVLSEEIMKDQKT